MNARTVRLPQMLMAEADAYAESLGIAFNALAAVALRDYLDARKTPTTAEALPIQSPCPVKAAPKPPRAQTSAPKHAAPPRVGAGSAKVGRNDPCPCGSGQKFKRCHGLAGSEKL